MPCWRAISLGRFTSFPLSCINLAAVVGQHMLHGLPVRDWRAHGLAAGIAGSGVAAAQVAARNELRAAFAALGIGLNGLLTPILVPMLVRLWH
jgi:putative effector of murein hydrolase